MKPLFFFTLSAIATFAATGGATPLALHPPPARLNQYEAPKLDKERLSPASAFRREAGIPLYMLPMVSKPPLEIAFLLADALVPSGIELTSKDDIYPELPAKAALDPTHRVPMDDFVRAFNSARKDYRASVRNGTCLITPATGVFPFLDAHSDIREPVTVIGTMDALRRVFSPLDARLLGPSIGSGIGSEAARNLTRRFVLDGSGGRRVVDTLNQIAVQTPGAWQVTTEQVNGKPQIVEFGFIYADRTRSVHSMQLR